MTRLKEWGLKGTHMVPAQCGTIRMRLLAGVAYRSVFKLSLSSYYPWQPPRVLANSRAYPALGA